MLAANDGSARPEELWLPQESAWAQYAAQVRVQRA